jgi:protein gp37
MSASLIPPARPPWATTTWNVVRGCSEVGRGCTNCTSRYHAAKNSTPGAHHDGLAFWHSRETGRRSYSPELAGPSAIDYWSGEVRLAESLQVPGSWRAHEIAAVAWHSDFFHPGVPPSRVESVLHAVGYYDRHRFVITTRRPERMREISGQPDLGRLVASLGNLALGASACDQESAEEALEQVLEVPSSVRFLCLEPLLGPVVLPESARPRGRWRSGVPGGIDWLLIGYETGARARLGNADWARALIDQAAFWGLPVYVHQLGPRIEDAGVVMVMNHPRGSKPEEWPMELNVRQMPREWAR